MYETRIEVRLKPHAKNDRINLDAATGSIDIAVTSPPFDDRANEHMIELLSDRLNVPRRVISIIKGGHSRNKVVAVEGLKKEELMRRLQKISDEF
ncbi:MAG: DUF167 domain-containing protein [Chitinispirillaceae bacterium]|jgi:uncharacterized protein (TIGR00251 family)